MISVLLFAIDPHSSFTAVVVRMTKKVPWLRFELLLACPLFFFFIAHSLKIRPGVRVASAIPLASGRAKRVLSVGRLRK